MELTRQPWIASPLVDGTLILGPAFLSTLVAWHFAARTGEEISGVAWLVLIVGVDVAHVYATLFRTYLDHDERRSRPALYALAPLVGWLAGVLLYSAGPLIFWRAAAYLAVFHFVRQQYGFFRIYSREERETPTGRALGAGAIYVATLYPLLFWHTHLPRRFYWFLPGDFLSLPRSSWDRAGFLVYVATLAAYAARELLRFGASRKLNLPRNALVLGTAVSWYVGIVGSNGDFAFTVTNVVSHGVPYLALVWLYGAKRARAAPERPLFGRFSRDRFFSPGLVPLYLGSLVTLAYLEEALWDGFIWRDHPRVFQMARHFPLVQDPATLAWLVPLLALPQITHYLLDGFIWRLGAGEKAEGEDSHVLIGHPSLDRAL